LVALDISQTLDEAGLDVVGIAHTVADALHFISGHAIDLVLLDANLAGEPVEEIAATLIGRRIPFAFLTGYGIENLPAEFRKQPLLTKPFTKQQLISSVTELSSRTVAKIIKLGHS
jgi:CheY-like chemotaxis protein